jgi:bifunctional non-homologous end joining protein LigD
MPLEEYQRKRDFRKTPEPAGGASGEARADGEASGGPRAATLSVRPGGRFVVQRHRATRLHYDVRLEIGGVLVSWAVPKGPTLDPAQRRMAVHVEDHPIEYFDFEGVIPKGEYGGGDVIVWDWGTWAPEAETPDPGPAIAAGELKFVVRGEKLRGRFTIVRTSGRKGRRGDDPAARAFEDDAGEQWLLIHKRDEHAVPGWDAEAYPQSVKTGRTNDEVRDARDAIWAARAPAATAEIDLSNAIDAPMPAFIAPMAATLAGRAFQDDDWLFEVKWDGYRLQAVVRDGTVRTFTRNGKDGETYFPGLLAPPTWIDAREAIVDGEVVALDAAGKPDFGLLQEMLGSAPRAHGDGTLVFQAFDLLHLDGRSLLRVPLEERKALLRLALRTGDRRVRYADHVVREGVAFLQAAEEQGLEGVIAKHRRSIYEPGVRSRAWLKVKHRPEQELVVGGWTPGEGSAKELGALVIGVHEDDQATGTRRLRFAGKVGSGFTAAMRARLRARLAGLEQAEPPFDPPPPRDYRGRWGGDLDGVVWVRPELVIRASLGGWTRDDLVRQAAFKGIDEGKDPAEVMRERAVATGPTVKAVEALIPDEAAVPPVALQDASDASPDHAWTATEAELAALDAMTRDGTWHVGGFDVKLTNLDKVLFPGRPGAGGDPSAPGADRPSLGGDPPTEAGSAPEPPVTKRDLIRYFARIAPVMLPHLARRPLNLHRFPDGAEKPGFWQKNVPASAPAWLPRWRETGLEAGGSTAREANDHLVADGVASLAWLANQAAFEVHAWTSTLADPFRPTFALIDIDPGEATTPDETLTLARLYRTALEHLGVRGYPKTTGRRGVQIWIPVIRGRYGYGETSAWVEKLSRAVGGIVPDLVSWEWSKAERKGRARLDYTQNAQIKTLVAPYAVRPAPGAPVSTPITWAELDDADLRSDRWTIRTAPERVARLGDLFAGAQADAQELPPI